MDRKILAVMLFLGPWALGCSGGGSASECSANGVEDRVEGSSDGSGEVPSCEALAKQASALVMGVVADNQNNCEVESGCVVVPVNGDCFDHCTQTLSAVGKELLDQAMEQANQDICARRTGCTLILPPCAPPTSDFVECIEGSCGAD